MAKSTPNSQNGRPINLPPVRNIPVNISGTGLPGRIAPNGLGGFTGNLGNDASITGNVAPVRGPFNPPLGVPNRKG